MPPYRLQTLLDMRTRAKEEAEQAFSDAIKALEREKAELQRLMDELERRKRERKEKVAAYLKEVMAKGAGINGMNMMGRFEERLKDEEAQVALEVERQREAVKVAERVVEQRRREMAEAAKELKAIEKHKETWQKQVKHERQQREELNQEEIGNALFLARQRK
ncbi:FliJ family protein [Myxococcus stipitatus DSM 14675]|uniref:FliJ family protein n=1 Tax=Myxococcus stipitatus (strain DSM 14675 / JCM 12634 / Mx s8) TaxID=1278073 RepID=L7U8J6_MYXSD|nr:FliJ family protein [Myxococcus stipitatus]AGC44150.1 FliJ family protein [Myxococcus stipitatus DSM 14675]